MFQTTGTGNGGRVNFTNQRARKDGEIDEVQRAKSRNKSKVRARVEHVFAVVKRLWGFTKVRYRGLAKNAHAFVRGAQPGQYLPVAQALGMSASKVRAKRLWTFDTGAVLRLYWLIKASKHLDAPPRNGISPKSAACSALP